MTGVFVDRSQQFADSLRVGACGAVLYFKRCQCAAQIGGGIVLGTPRSNGIPEYLTRALLCSVRRFDLPARFQLAERRE